VLQHALQQTLRDLATAGCQACVVQLCLLLLLLLLLLL
jgi:hypothetical protein